MNVFISYSIQIDVQYDVELRNIFPIMLNAYLKNYDIFNVMPSWFMKRFSSVSSYSITRRTLCYFTKYILIILYRTISFNFISTRT